MDIYNAGMLSIPEAARYLVMPETTLADWRRAGVIHSVEPEHRGWPSLPFAAVVEAFVPRALRSETKFPMRRIKEAAQGLRKAYDDDYGLVRPRIVYDAADIFIDIGGEFYRARDQQQAVRETVTSFKKLIDWKDEDPQRLRLRHFSGSVILDPRFGWGRPVVEANKVPVEAIMGLWRAEESLEAIAAEFGMDRADVQRLIQQYDRASAAA